MFKTTAEVIDGFQDYAEEMGDFNQSLQLNWLRNAMNTQQLTDEFIIEFLVRAHYGQNPNLPKLW